MCYICDIKRFLLVEPCDHIVDYSSGISIYYDKNDLFLNQKTLKTITIYILLKLATLFVIRPLI